MQTGIMTIRDVAGYLKLTGTTAYRLAAKGEIPGVEVGGAWRFRRGETERWIEGETNGRAPKP
jgi:excisionase family DNA binding protein